MDIPNKKCNYCRTIQPIYIVLNIDNRKVCERCYQIMRSYKHPPNTKDVDRKSVPLNLFIRKL